MPATFNTPDKFDKLKAFSRILFGDDAYLMEVELNEMQKILLDKFASTIESIVIDGFVSPDNFTITAGVLTMPEYTSFIHKGVLYQTVEPMSISVTTNDSIYLEIWEQEVNFQTTIRQGGNVNGTIIADNGIFDPRAGEETSRRIQTQMRLSKTASTPGRFSIFIATVTSASTVTDRRVMARLRINPVTINASSLFQDALNRLVTDAQIAYWNGKQDASQKGLANGYAPLDADRRLPAIHYQPQVMRTDANIDYGNRLNLNAGNGRLVLPVGTDKYAT